MIVYITIVVCSVAWIFLIVPSIVYLLTIWKIKFEYLRAYFDEGDLETYFKQFYRSKDIREGDLGDLFDKRIHRSFGKRRYILPLFFLSIVSGIGIIFVAINIIYWLDHNEFKLPPVVISAFLGAYMWVAYDQFQRLRMRDFTSHDIYLCSFRLLIAIPLGVSFAAIIKDPVGVPLAFFLGSFPARTLLKYGRRFVNTNLGIGKQSDEKTSELEQLQSINRVEAERYQEEGKTNILQLAYSDPVELTLRTNFEFNYVLDCISQALLWLYLGKNISKLYPLGLRGAHEAFILNEALNSDDSDSKKIAEDNFKEIAKVLDIKEKALQQTLIDVAEDPYTEFILDIWR